MSAFDDPSSLRSDPERPHQVHPLPPANAPGATAAGGVVREPGGDAGNRTILVPTVTQCAFVGVTGAPNQRIAAIAEAQEGRVARWQLRTAEISDEQIRWRRRSGLLIPRMRGVYASGHDTATAHSAEIEALLTRGPGALICSHRAAGLHSIRPMCAGVDLLVPHTRSARPRGPEIRIHRSATAEHLEPDHVGGIPVVSVAYALLEIAGDLSRRQVEVALDEAFSLGRVNRDDVRHVVAANPTFPGAGLLAALIGLRLVGNPTRSEGQEKLLALVRDAGLPDPEMDARVGGGFTIDLYWRKARLGAEYDSYTWHSRRGPWARDRRKDEYCKEHGIELVRVVEENFRGGEPLRLAARIARLLGERSREIPGTGGRAG